MAKPNVKRVPISLSTGENSSYFWMKVIGLNTLEGETPNSLVIIQKDGSDGYWTGEITVAPKDDKTSIPSRQRARVNYIPGPPPGSVAGRETSRKILGPGDIVEVTITVTNNTETSQSGSVDGEVIVDLGPAEI